MSSGVVAASPSGIITGLSHKQTMGAAYYRSASALWSGNLTDAYFLAGGIIFGLLGRRYRPRGEAHREARPPGRIRDTRRVTTGADR